MTKLIRIFTVVALFSLTLAGSAFAGTWSSTSISYLQGSGYEFHDSEDAAILTLEHASGWAYGDNFFFLDIFQPFDKDISQYGEWHPRLSFGKISNKNMGFGPVKDVLLATEINFGDGLRTYLYGVGFDLDVPYFNFVSLNVYFRDNPAIEESATWQISPAWNLPVTIGNTSWTIGGFLDIMGAQVDGANTEWLFVPQVMLDLGALSDKPGNLYAGIEWQYWGSKYGSDVDENVVQALVKWFF